MPCDTTTTVTAEVGKWDAERAAEAIKEAGLQNVVRLVNGRLTTNVISPQQGESNISKVKQQYAALTLKAAAKRFNWNPSAQTTTKTGLIQFNLTRR
jgi:hypothetical protein